MFHEGDKVLWTYQSGWGGGATRKADAEIVKVNRVTVRIRVWRKVGNELREEIKDVSPTSLQESPVCYHLHRISKDGWRDSVLMAMGATKFSKKLQELRQKESMQWFIVRHRDGVIIAQSKNCKWTIKSEGWV